MKLRLNSIKNIRDFSEFGYANCIRSAHLHEAAAADLETLIHKHGLKTIIDLRTSQEVEEKPDVVPPGVAYVHIPFFEGAVPGISHENETDELRRVIPDMAKMYELLASEEAHVAQIRKVMAVINDPAREGTVLWHCTEGKDRCGIISALFLLSHGVSRDAVMKDYLKTNRANLGKAWKLYFLVWLSRKDRVFAAQVRDAFLAKREYLAPILDRLTELARIL